MNCAKNKKLPTLPSDEIRNKLHKSSTTKVTEQLIIKNLLSDYDWRIRPQGQNKSWPDTGGPVVITVNIFLRSISKIDDVNMVWDNIVVLKLIY